MSVRVSPIEAIHGQIDELFASGRPLEEVIEEVGRLGARLLLQQAMEAEVDEFLGRARYQRAAAAGETRPGMRNGHHSVTVKTTAGPVTLARPKLRGTTERFCSALFGATVVRSNALEALVIGSFVRGLSVRDVEATLAEALGQDATVSKSAVSRVCAQVAEEFNAWARRDLSDVEIDYLFLDASVFKMHDSVRGEPLLAAWAITSDGKPVLLHLAIAGSESTDAWDGFLSDLKDRGLRAPLLVVSDGAKGLIAAVEANWPGALRQRCAIHVARNLAAKLPETEAEGIMGQYWACFDVTDLLAPDELGRKLDPGPDLVAVVDRRVEALASKYAGVYPGFAKCLRADAAALTAHLNMPAAHHRRVRHSNLIERTFGETRRRVKVIGRLPGETSCLTLVYGVLSRAAAGWRGLTYTPRIIREQAALRRRLFDPPRQLRPPTDTPTADAENVRAVA